jgi:hypothetical protein
VGKVRRLHPFGSLLWNLCIFPGIYRCGFFFLVMRLSGGRSDGLRNTTQDGRDLLHPQRPLPRFVSLPRSRHFAPILTALLGVAARVNPTSTFFACVGFRSVGESVRVNLGHRPFRFNFEVGTPIPLRDTALATCLNRSLPSSVSADSIRLSKVDGVPTELINIAPCFISREGSGLLFFNPRGFLCTFDPKTKHFTEHKVTKEVTRP